MEHPSLLLADSSLPTDGREDSAIQGHAKTLLDEDALKEINLLTDLLNVIWQIDIGIKRIFTRFIETR